MGDLHRHLDHLRFQAIPFARFCQDRYDTLIQELENSNVQLVESRQVDHQFVSQMRELAALRVEHAALTAHYKDAYSRFWAVARSLNQDVALPTPASLTRPRSESGSALTRFKSLILRLPTLPTISVMLRIPIPKFLSQSCLIFLKNPRSSGKVAPLKKMPTIPRYYVPSLNLAWIGVVPNNLVIILVRRVLLATPLSWVLCRTR
ncbi:hypothetical protein PHPALM_28532 [Phytophthora palmivora]|uniref:Uncharacterized protein n=1 Tax=Phytophthora palmivora TaxID=4796 RepID=A0A2P4X9X6_9STRA|nr:hypothetical protein PHPALM_28532 [Phytophthora palmivora]